MPRSSSEQRSVGSVSSGASSPERLRIRVLREFGHDTTAYTQGLVWDEGSLVESTGRYGESRLRRWRPSTQDAVSEVSLPSQFFGEGLAVVGERLIQLTWREGVALVWDRETFAPIDRISYQGEGWGLCYDGRRLAMSDGSDTLTFRDPDSFLSLRQLKVSSQGVPLENLNELECAEGWIYANIFGGDHIARIDPGSGVVTALIDASGLLSRRERDRADVLNGIAYNPETETFFLTGKLWPKVFEVVFETQ